jgi:hypothetical protein
MKKIDTRGRGKGSREPERRVFVLDDDPSVRKSLATLLSTDYTVQTSPAQSSIWTSFRTPDQRVSYLMCGCRDSTASPSNDNSRTKAEWSRSYSSPGTVIYRWESVR